jgi:hypothetical protein
MSAIRIRTWHTDRVAWASFAAGVAAMAFATYFALAFEGYEDTTARVAPLVRLRVPLFLAASASAVAGPLVVTIGQWLDGRATLPSIDKPKAWSLEEL